MRGKSGMSIIEVDVFGNQIREIERTQPIRPSNLYLSLNLKLQQLAREELYGRKGEIIAIDPNTGCIKALVSSPDYNPNVLNKAENGFSYPRDNQRDAPLCNLIEYQPTLIEYQLALMECQSASMECQLTLME